jgi:hypothetical protein
MIKEAIDKILDLAPIHLESVEGEAYFKDSQRLKRLKRPHEFVPAELVFYNLTGLKSYIERNPDNLDTSILFLHVVDFNQVDLLGPLQPHNNNTRFLYARAVDSRVHFAFGKFMNLEQFIICILTNFVHGRENDDSEAIIKMLGNMANEDIKTNKDDGFSQSIQIKTGLTTKAAVEVSNPVVLYPYRTFIELDQPAHNAVLRFQQAEGRETKVALFEADGGGWRVEAVHLIRDWLKEHLPLITILA